MGSNGSDADELTDELVELGFAKQGVSRRGGGMWELAFNQFLTFTLHDYGDHVILTWRCDLGTYLLTRGLQVGAAETSFQELYPQTDVRLEPEMRAIRAEITRTLAGLRFDLGDPNL